MRGVRLLSLLAIFSSSQSSPCTDECDARYPVGAPNTFAATLCGTDGETHRSTTQALDGDYCYATCGVMTAHQGVCGCPNDCSSSLNQGQCAPSGVCACLAGWTGVDCSLPTVGNACSLHGRVIPAGSAESVFPFDYCVCDEGWTGVDCSSPTLRLSPTPWGEIFADIPEYQAYYTESDKYRDDHPIWNLSQLATIRVELREEDYHYLLLPENLYNESYVSATMHFDNGVVRQSLANVGFRVKGAYSRLDQKKGFALKFNAFVSKQKFFDMKKIAMKAGSVADDTILKTKLFADFVRAVGVPTQRSSYALLFVNNQFTGLYYLHEDIDTQFLQARLPGDDGRGNLYKYFWSVHLSYYGDDPRVYQEMVHVNEIGYPMPYYEQSEGDGDWTDIIAFYRKLNTTSSAEAFEEEAERLVDVSRTLRAMVVESFLLATDNSAAGGNFFNYRRSSKEKEDNRWLLFDADFDECFAFDAVTNKPRGNPDVLDFFLRQQKASDFRKNNLLFQFLLTSPKYRTLYLNYYTQFLEITFGSTSKELPSERYAAMMQFLLPWVKRDKLWQMSFGLTAQEFLIDAERSIANLPLRYQDVMKQIASLRGDVQ